MKKNIPILISCLAFSACSCPPVACHAWTDSELSELKKEDKALPQDAAMRALVKNYEAICAA